ncbi:MAG TPA: ribonuclease P protein component [Candidatus Latescibacteria bacterium]|nr:ribonuclease P protein component [Candidatus Latescibacterota bacterium]
MRRETETTRWIRTVREEIPARRGSFLVAWVDKSSQRELPVVIVGRTVGKAHERNRVRRRIREALRACVANPAGIIVVARTRARAADYWNLLNELEGLLAESDARMGGDRSD